MQRVAGVQVDGRGAVLSGMSRDEINAQQVGGLGLAAGGGAGLRGAGHCGEGLDICTGVGDRKSVV